MIFAIIIFVHCILPNRISMQRDMEAEMMGFQRPPKLKDTAVPTLNCIISVMYLPVWFCQLLQISPTRCWLIMHLPLSMHAKCWHNTYHNDMSRMCTKQQWNTGGMHILLFCNSILPPDLFKNISFCILDLHSLSLTGSDTQVATSVWQIKKRHRYNICKWYYQQQSQIWWSHQEFDMRRGFHRWNWRWR